MEQQRAADLLVLGPDIVTFDAGRRMIRDGAIAVADGRIVWIGPSTEARTLFNAQSTIYAQGQIAMPGLIDAHFHTAQQLIRGKIVEISRRRQLKLPVWRNYFLPFESCLDEEDVYLSGLLAYSNMIRVGTTCFAEAGGPFPDQMGRAAEEVGIRGFIALSTMDMDFAESVPPSMKMTTQQAIAENEALVKRWNGSQGSGRVRAWLALRQLIVCSEELWIAFRDLANQLGVRMHTHLAEGVYELDFAAERWGKRPAEHLDSIGSLGSHVHAAHSILLSDHEVDLYAQHRVTAAHCPMGNYLIGPPKVAQMWRRGIAIGLGSDGASNGTLDLFRLASIAWVAQQSNFGTPWYDRTVLGAEDCLVIATIGGARALGAGDELGSLEVGKRADFILVDPTELDMQPVYDPAFTLARGVSGRDVRTVIVDGQVVMKDRELLLVDEAEVRARINERWPRIMERFEALVA